MKIIESKQGIGAKTIVPSIVACIFLSCVAIFMLVMSGGFLDSSNDTKQLLGGVCVAMAVIMFGLVFTVILVTLLSGKAHICVYSDHVEGSAVIGQMSKSFRLSPFHLTFDKILAAEYKPEKGVPSITITSISGEKYTVFTPNAYEITQAIDSIKKEINTAV